MVKIFLCQRAKTQSNLNPELKMKTVRNTLWERTWSNEVCQSKLPQKVHLKTSRSNYLWEKLQQTVYSL